MASDFRYKQFRTDIGNFRQLLKKLNTALQNAEQRYSRKGPLSPDFDAERKAILGDFIETLEACELVLQDHKDLRSGSNVIKNLQWHLTQQEQRVDDLRQRLHFHCEKIRIVIDSVSLGVLADVDAKQDDILVALNSLLRRVDGFGPDNVHVVSDNIAQRFNSHILDNAPVGTEAGIPMIEGFDALVSHWDSCAENLDGSPEAFLQFLKSLWLLELLKKSTGFRNARPGFYYKRAIKQLEQEILETVRDSGELQSFDESSLMSLSDTYFHIWPTARNPHLDSTWPKQLIAAPDEEAPLCLNLAPRKQNETESVTVFKGPKDRFRIVPTVTLASAPSQPIPGESQVMVCSQDYLIPRHAFPAFHKANLEVAVLARGREALYKFESWEDLRTFQTALTGYEVPHEQRGVDCQLSKDDYTDGYVQLWQDPIPSLSNRPDSASLRTVSNVGEDLTFEDALLRRDSLVSAHSSSSGTIDWRNEDLTATRIKLPAITIFTRVVEKKNKKRLAILFIELTHDIYIDSNSCKCHRQYDKCLDLALVSRKKRDFPVRILCSEVDSKDINLLAFRLPRGKDFESLETKKTKDILLSFGNLAEKEKFHRALHKRLLLRDQQIKKQDEITKKIRHLQDQPKKRRTMSQSQSPSVSSTSTQLSSTASFPPRVDVPDYGPDLLDAFDRGTSLGD